MNKQLKWPQSEFSEILARKPEYGANAPSVPFREGQTPRLIRITDIGASGRLIEESKVGIDPDAARGYEVESGDLLIARSGATVGKSLLIRPETSPAAFAGYLIRFVIDEKKALRPFVVQYLNSPPYWQWVKTMLRAGAQPNINAQEYCTLLVPTPPLPEQRKIADILTAWDEVLEKLDALIAAKERRKKALMQQLLAGRMRFPGFSKNPWKKRRMGELLTRVFRPIEWTADMQLSLVSLRRRCGGLFRRADVQGGDYKTHDLHELKANDFLISKRQVAHGAWALVPPGFGGSHVSKEYAIFVNRSPDKLHMPFFAWLAQTPRMIRLARVASTGVHIEKLIFDPEVFLREYIRIPAAVIEQKRIADILDVAQADLHILRAKRTALDQQKRGLMQRLLTGKVRAGIAKNDTDQQ